MIIKYLWKNRKYHRIFSYRWIILWGKRIKTFFPLLKIFFRVEVLRMKGAKIGALTVIAPSIFNGRAARLKIGSMTSIGRISAHLHENIDIGDYVVINDGVSLLTASHSIDSSEWRQFAKPIIIGDYAWVATNAIILPGVRIGRGAVVGAGAVVTKDVPDFCIVVGNPAIAISKKRCVNFTYNPVSFIACYEAWLGH